MAIIKIKNVGDFQRFGLPIVSTVLEEVQKKVRIILLDNITKYTYEFGRPDGSEMFDMLNISYHDETGKPTFEFYLSWEWQILSSTTDRIVRELFSNSDAMTFDPATFLHGSEETGDVRDKLPAILNVDGVSAGDFSDRPHAKVRKPYWDITIDELFNQGRLKEIVDEEFAKFGIKPR